MTPEIKTAINNRNELRKTIANNRETWVEACKTTANMIAERKSEMWRQYVTEISATTSSKQIWRTIRAMDGRKPPEKSNEVLEMDGKTYVEDKDKAKQFAKTCKNFAKIPIKIESSGSLSGKE